MGQSRTRRHTSIRRRVEAALGSGNMSPERMAAERMRSLFTFVAAQRVLEQLSGSGRGALGAYDTVGYSDLEQHIVNQKLNEANSEEWLHALAERNSRIAARVMEVREAYGTEEFEWENCKALADTLLSEGNAAIMRSYLARLDNAMQGSNDDDSPGGGIGET